MRFKLNRMRNTMLDAPYKAHNRRARQMQYAMQLIDRINTDEYLSAEVRQLETKYGELNWTFIPVSGEPELLELQSWYTRDDGTAEDAWLALYQRQSAIRQRDLTRLFKHMRKYIEGWWA